MATATLPTKSKPVRSVATKPARAATKGARTRVVVANPADGGFFYWLGKLYAFAGLIAAIGVVLGCILTYRYFAVSAPPVPDLRAYAKVTPAISRIYAADGTLMGEFAQEWRQLTPYDQIPEPLIKAFLAVEDHAYFTHGGIYLKGILRAAWANITAGDFAQGGSTITQQVAKQFLGAEKSLTRKAKEAVMARRLESRYSKKAILSVYLNHIFLGAGAYGVAAAARRYFDKDLSELTLAESALIAGLAQAPSRYSPIRSPALAIERRDVVLDKMLEWGFATADEVATAKKEPLQLKVYKDIFPDRMPYYAEHVRRYVNDSPTLKATFGDNPLMTGGLRVEAAVEPSWEAGAYGNVDYSTHKQDKRQGWRGPEWYLGDESTRAIFVERQKALYGTGPLAPGRRYLALVEDVDSRGAEVRVGDRKLELPMKNMNWAAEWKSGSRADNDRKINNATKALKVGDVIWVSREIRTWAKFREYYYRDGSLNPQWRPSEDERAWDEGNADQVVLEQVPHPQGTIFTGDHRTGYVTTMVGGHDYDRSQFNRAVQACRQPGSVFKPIYYGYALEEGYGYDTQLSDSRVTIIDPVTGAVWTPTNLHDDLDGSVSLEYALVFSKNIPSIGLFKKLGAKEVVKWARKLGFRTKMYADDALALGASCTYMDELTKAFAIYARDGKDFEWKYVRRILDRNGNTVEDNTVPYDPMMSAGDRLDRAYATAEVEEPQAVSVRTAFLMQKLLAQVVQHGLEKPIRQTGIWAGGKTGTSSDTHDTWFMGFTSQFISLVWLGDDKKQRALGVHDAAYITVVPMWARYMWENAADYPNPELPWAVPKGQKADDRGDHSKGNRGGRMTLVRHYKNDVLEANGMLPEGDGGEGGGGGEDKPPGT